MTTKPTKKKAIRVVAFGFDKFGFEPPESSHESTFSISFEKYSSSEPFAGARGIIVPSGIFETIETHSNYGGSWTSCDCDSHRMAEIEKQLHNAVGNGAWACLMVRSLRNGEGGGTEWWDRDLVKKLANQCFESLEQHEPLPHIQCKADEFRPFIEKHGIARTGFHFPRRESETRKIAETDRAIYAAEVGGKLFFLPLKQIPNNDDDYLLDLLRTAVEAVLKYKQRHQFYFPPWVEELKFHGEVATSKRLGQIADEKLSLEAELSQWHGYKGILCASGHGLASAVVSVFRDFFSLNIRSEERFVEDAILQDAAGNPLMVLEIKGINGGVRREHINQVDSHRERLEVPPTVPGLLIVNDFADVDDLEARKQKAVDPSHLDLARKLNVRILRTTTLMDIMFSLEAEASRGERLVAACIAADPLVHSMTPPK